MIVRYLKDNELTHHGIKGQKWGVRRYQNPDGSLTNAGKKRYLKEWKKAYNKGQSASHYDDYYKPIEKLDDYKKVKKSLANDKAFIETIKERKQLEKELDSLRNEYSQNALKWVKQAVKNQYGYSDKELTSEDGRSRIWSWYNDDGDQGGNGGAFDMFLKSKGSSYDEWDTKLDNLFNKQNKIVNDAIQDVLKEKMDYSIKNKYGGQSKISDLVERTLDSDKSSNYGYIPFYGFGDNPGWYDDETDSIKNHI